VAKATDDASQAPLSGHEAGKGGSVPRPRLLRRPVADADRIEQIEA
jgi:hypothetical protein